MKKIFTLLASAALLFTACDSLQDSLSEQMQAKLDAETGKASYSYKNWYYNGIAGEDISNIEGHTMLIDFGKKIALSSSGLSGKISVTYTDDKGCDVVKTFSTLNGYFTSDYTGFRLNMSNVTALFDGVSIPGGTAVMDVSLSGFVCAEGNQKGRTISSFEAKNINIKPLFNSDSYSFSTVGFSTDTVFEISCNALLTVEEGVTVKAEDDDNNSYTFTVKASGTNLYLTPRFGKAPSDGTEIVIPLEGFTASGSGDSYSKEIKASFTDKYIVLDGYKDSNWTSDKVSYVSDAASDATAFTWAAADADFTGLYAVSDDNYLYIAIEGTFATKWNDGLAIMISKDHSSDAAYTAGSSTFALADTVSYGRESLANGKPDLYIYHMPQNGSLGAWLESSDSSASEITSSVVASPSKADSSEFIEYAIPLTSLSNFENSTIYIMASYSAHWKDGIAAADVVPDSCASLNENHNSIGINFKNALKYTIQ